MTTATQENPLTTAQTQAKRLIGDLQSVVIASIDSDNTPHSSYSPVVYDGGKAYCYMSTIAQHARNLQHSSKASLMWIDEESQTKQIFARNRLTFDCTAQALEFEEQETKHPLFVEKFGKIVDGFMKMKDFSIYEFTPISGRLVIGFGQAYDVSADLETIQHVTGGGKGHEQRS